MNDGRYRFSDFILEIRERRLLKAGNEISLRPKTFDLLSYLVRHAGQLVTKEELFAQVWPDTVVTDNVLAQSIKEIRHALQDETAEPRYIRTIPRAGYRFVGSVEQLTGRQPAAADGKDPTHKEPRRASPLPGRTARRLLWLAGGVLIIVAGVLLLQSRTSLSFEPRDWVLVCDFDNHTRDTLYALALRAVLERELGSSAYLNVVPSARVGDALALMKRDRGMPITEQAGREICIRDGGIRLLLSGSIHEIGGRFTLAVNMIEPHSGITVARVSDHASGVGEVLPAMTRLAKEVRATLGESAASVKATEVQMEKVTTPSFAALEYFTRGWRLKDEFRWPEAMILFREAGRIDSTFAMNETALGFAHLWLGNPEESGDHFARAVRHVDAATDREKYFINGSYAAYALGDLPEAIAAYELLVHQFPDDYWGNENLSMAYLWTGAFERSQQLKTTCVRIRPHYAINYSDLGINVLFIEGNVDKADSLFRFALRLNPDLPLDMPHLSGMWLAWLRNDFDRADSAAASFLQTRQAVLLPPFQATAMQFIARYHFSLGRTQKGMEALQQSLKLAARLQLTEIHPWIQLEVALTEGELGRIPRAEDMLRTMVTTQRGSARMQALGWLGISDARTGALHKALNALRLIAADTSTTGLGILHPPLPGELDKTRAAFSEQIAGEIAAQEGSTDLAMRHFRRVLEIVPPSQLPALSAMDPRLRLVALQSMARISSQKSDWETAISSYKSILELKRLAITVPAASPVWLDALSSIGTVLENAGQTESAASFRAEYDLVTAHRNPPHHFFTNTPSVSPSR